MRSHDLLDSLLRLPTQKKKKKLQLDQFYVTLYSVTLICRQIHMYIILIIFIFIYLYDNSKKQNWYLRLLWLS